MLRRSTAALAALLLAPLAGAQPHPILDTGGAVPYDAAAYDVRHYDIGLMVDPGTRSFAGTTTVTARFVHPHSEFVLDLDTTFAVRAARLDGQVRPVRRDGGQLRVQLGRTVQPGETVRVAVTYSGAPRVARRAPWDGGVTWGRTPAGLPWITTTVQGEGCDLWYPCKDYPSDEADSVDLAVTVPAPLVVATNGRLVAVEPGNGPYAPAGAPGIPPTASWRRYRWHVAHATNTYGLALNIGPYVTLDQTYQSVTGETIPLQFFVLPERKADAERLLPQVREQVRFFEEWLGPYPWRRDKLGIAHTPHLGMEHQSIIAYGSTFQNDEDGFDWLYHHEFAHEYFGNLATAWDWRDFWLHEGTGTYMQVLYAERLGGREAGLRRLRRTARFANEIPVAPRAITSNDAIYQLPSGASNLDIYYKGAWILHTLRGLVGDDAFRRTLRRFLYPTPESERSPRPGRFVTTEDFVATASREAGRDLRWFFDVYVHEAPLPRLVAETTPAGLRLRWDVPRGLPFPMPVDVQVGRQTRRVDVPAAGVTVPVPRGQRAVVDPGGWLLRAD